MAVPSANIEERPSAGLMAMLNRILKAGRAENKKAGRKRAVSWCFEQIDHGDRLHPGTAMQKQKMTPGGTLRRRHRFGHGYGAATGGLESLAAVMASTCCTIRHP